MSVVLTLDLYCSVIMIFKVYSNLELGGKNKEIVKLKNLEHIPFTFSFDRESVKGDPEYGDSLMVNQEY